MLRSLAVVLDYSRRVCRLVIIILLLGDPAIIWLMAAEIYAYDRQVAKPASNVSVESTMRALRWRSQSFPRGYSLKDRSDQGKQSEEDADASESDDAPERIVAVGVSFVSPESTKTFGFLRIHVCP